MAMLYSKAAIGGACGVNIQLPLIAAMLGAWVTASRLAVLPAATIVAAAARRVLRSMPGVVTTILLPVTMVVGGAGLLLEEALVPYEEHDRPSLADRDLAKASSGT